MNILNIASIHVDVLSGQAASGHLALRGLGHVRMRHHHLVVLFGKYQFHFLPPAIAI